MTSESEPLRCLIVDDEGPAREELRYLLEGIAGTQVVGAAASAEEAELLLRAVDYDVVFLDIRMPGAGGLELARRLADRPNSPQVVFTTAYPDHAVDAFELSAADYLLKPFDTVRLEQALSRARERSRVSERSRDADLRATTDGPQPPGADGAAAVSTSAADSAGSPAGSAPPGATDNRPAGRLPVQRGERTVFVDEREIVVASAARGYCYVTLQHERVLVNYSLSDLEGRLSERMLRVHRSHLVNLDRVAELRSDYRGGLMLVMDDRSATEVPVSRRHGTALRRRLGL